VQPAPKNSVRYVVLKAPFIIPSATRDPLPSEFANEIAAGRDLVRLTRQDERPKGVTPDRIIGLISGWFIPWSDSAPNPRAEYCQKARAVPSAAPR